MLEYSAKKLMANHVDFFIREAFAHWMLNHPHVDDLEFAEQLSNDSYDQVARPARGALRAINRMTHYSS